jgi:TRAP transporter TAXI family solute receptor
MEEAMKQKRLIMSLVLCAVLIFAAEGNAEKFNLLFASGSVAGTFYPLAGAIAQVWNKNIPDLNVTVTASGASLENIRLLGTKKTEIGLAMNDVAFYGYNGLEFFQAKNEKYTNFSAIGNVYPDTVQLFCRKDGSIKDIADLKGKKVVVGMPGSGNEISARQILGLYGIDYKTRKDLNPLYLNYAEAADQFKDNLVDVCYFMVAVPNGAIADINVMNPVQFLGFDDAMFAKIKKTYPLYARAEIPANAYRGQDKPVQTIAVYSSIYVSNDLPENIVYQMTKVLYEESAAIAQAHAAGKFIKLETFTTGGISIPYHPGAIKYYKEKGIIK